MKETTQIYGLRAVIEAIQANEPINKIFIQKGLQGQLFFELESLVRKNRLAVSYVPLEKLNKLSQVAVGNTPAKDEMLILPNGVESLRDSDPFVQIISKMPISTQVRYHSIIANDTPKKDLLYSDDGLVPYQSSHLPGATSELVIPFSHSVQETPEAILEIRRILREQ